VVSVGEVLLALKFITKWREETGDHFVLLLTTVTGMAPKDVRVIYVSFDFGFLIRRVMKRLQPPVWLWWSRSFGPI
jgi:3-deoxy-D-manno-octulosonic-acid transferase